MDKELPWLADNAQLELKYKKGKTPLSHRKWPGEPVPVITESIIQTLGDELLQKAEKKKNIVWRYENFSLEWQSAITQAINLIGEHKPSVPARTMAALACIAQNDNQQLLDEIVQQEGLEYATEVVIARQFIARCYESDPLVVTLQYQNEDYGYGYRSETYNEFDLRLRKHLSLAEESSWQRCADKLIAALPGITKVRRPFIALILPEKPEIANELVSLECPRTHFHSKEWLKVVATDPREVRKLERYWSQDIFSDREASYMSHENHFGYAACAALLREQGLAVVPRLAIYAHKEDCGSLLVQINHPQVIRTLLLVADKNKPSLQRVAKYSKNFPHATLAALAELLALKEPPARPGYPANEPRCLLKAFRVAAEGEFCNAQDEPIDLPADALIGIAHPLEMTVEMRSEFAQLFADYEIMPPFRQLSRRTVLLTPDESTSNSLTRWEGKSATVGQLMGMRYKGWESGYEDAFVYDLGEYRLVLKFSPGFNHYNVDSKALMSFRSLRVYRDNKSVTFAELDVFDLSEALSAPDVIFH